MQSERGAAERLLGALGYRRCTSSSARSRSRVDEATVRLERYPGMDALVEVEGEPAAIERAIGVSGIPRVAFTADVADASSCAGTRRGTAGASARLTRRGRSSVGCARAGAFAWPTHRPRRRARRGPPALRLDDIRLRLVTGVFDLAGAGRGFAAAGDPQGAVASLNRVAWLALWEKALAAAAERITGLVNTRTGVGGRGIALPPRTARAAPPPGRGHPRHRGAAGAGRGTSRRGARRAGTGRARRRRERRRPRRRGVKASTRPRGGSRRPGSRWRRRRRTSSGTGRRKSSGSAAGGGPAGRCGSITALVIGAAAYVGLVLGGYLPVPPALEGLAEWWWSRW